MNMLMLMEEEHCLRHQPQALGMAKLPFVDRRQDVETDADRHLQREHPRHQELVNGEHGRHPYRRQAEVLLGVPEGRFDPSALAVLGHGFRRRPLGRHEQVPLWQPVWRQRLRSCAARRLKRVATRVAVKRRHRPYRLAGRRLVRGWLSSTIMPSIKASRYVRRNLP